MLCKRNNTTTNKILSFVIVFMLALGQIFMVAPVPWAEAGTEPTLVITGTGLNEDVFVYAADWADMVERTYSTNNTYNFHKILKVRGYDLFNLIGTDNLKTDQDYSVKLIASDGFQTSKNVSALQSQYYYPDMTVNSEQPAAPMIGYYSKELYTNSSPQAPITWEDAELTQSDLDGNAPRIYFGQEQGNIDDTNQSNFVRDLVRIVVGEERPDVLTVRGNGVSGEKSFSLTDLKSAPTDQLIDEDYLYNSRSGPKTASVKGVNLQYVLNTMVGITDSSAQVQFICSDGYEVEPVSQADIADPSLKYALVYEVDGAAVSDDNGNASLRIYRQQAYEGEFSTVTQAVSAIEVTGTGTGETIDFDNSPYKHVFYDGAPYNLDSITGATMTIEGPGVETYRALSLSQIEGTNAGLVRGTYAETINGQEVQNAYEGITVSYLLDNFVTLRENAGNVVLKDKSRHTIAEYSLDEIRRTDYLNNAAGANNLKMIVAYGINEVPLVYTNLEPGYDAAKYNDNGCFKLVCGQSAAGDPAPTFSNVAYIYVKEADAPGIYEHAQAPYNNSRYTNYILTLTGSGLGKEINYTVADLEAMTDLHLEKEYSLSNSYYFWYYNTYKGIPLWDLLLREGLDANIDESTPVNFQAADYYNFTPMTVAQIKNNDLYGYYEKDPLDLGDGTFDGSGVQPLETGYPVLIAYGYNGYPYVTSATDEGYNSGLGNNGGPLRVIFGKADYNDTNGSHQVQYAKRIVIGDDLPYSTHSYGDYEALGSSPLEIKVVGDDGSTIKDELLTVKDIEDMIYDVPTATADQAREKQKYFTKISGAGDKISDLYEGIGLNYLLFDKIGLPGTTGTVTFENEGGSSTLSVSLEDIIKSNYSNEVTGADDLKPVLAFAKNGYPMVKTRDDSGYLSSAYNRDGPLMAVFGQTETGSPGQYLANVQKITIQINQDSWAHLAEPYNQYASETLSISGSGLRTAKTATINELESMQNYISTGEYCLASSTEDKSSDRYRGIDIYEYLRREIGFTAGADSITFKDVNGTAQTFTVEQLSKRDYLNDVTGNSDLIVLLAYGKNEIPLVPNANSPGYNADINSSGGPFRLIVGQTEAGEFNSSRCLGEIKEIIVEAQAGDSWKHDHGDFTQYQDQAVLRVTGSQVTAPRTFSLKQLEALDQHIIRNIYLGDQEVEGVILWNLIKDVVGLKDGVTEPSSIRVFAGANYNQITNTSQVINGVVNSQGVTKDILAGYAVNSYPLVPESSSPGYINNNQYGPLRLIVEENGSMWIKWLDCIVVGDGTYEAPLAQDIIQDEPEGPAVFTVSGSGVSGAQDYTLEQLQGMEATTSQYSYTAGGELITDTCTGVPLAYLLAGLGISDPDWELNITSTDGYDYGTVTLQDIVDQNYLLAYSVNGSSFEDTKEGYPSSSIRIYRNFNDGSNWRNRLTLVRGVGVTSTTPVLITPVERDWAFYRNDDGSGLPLAGVRCITPDGNGGIWVGTNGGGAAYRNAGGTWTVYNKDNSALPHNSIYAIAVDETGGVWFAGGSPSDGMGIVYKKGDQWTVYTTENSNIPHDFAWSIALDNRGGAWFGTGAGPVYRDSEGNWTPRNNESFPAKSVSAIALDAQGGVWFGFCPETSTGESPGGYAYMNPQGEVTSYAETSTVTGGKWVRSISIDKDGGVWIARYGKVDYISASGERTIYETDADLLPFLTEGDSIRQVIADQEGGLWISTSASGLYYRNQAGEFMNYNAANTWPTAQFNSVWSVNSCQNGELWIGTNGGAAGIATPQSDDHPVYTIAPLSDSVYTAGTTADGINTMTVNTGITGFKYFTVNITPVDSHSGNETVVFTHSRNGTQLAINATRADFDTVQTAQSGFNVQAGDVIKAYIVDDLTNAADLNPVVFQ